MKLWVSLLPCWTAFLALTDLLLLEKSLPPVSISQIAFLQKRFWDKMYTNSGFQLQAKETESTQAPPRSLRAGTQLKARALGVGGGTKISTNISTAPFLPSMDSSLSSLSLWTGFGQCKISFSLKANILFIYFLHRKDKS